MSEADRANDNSSAGCDQCRDIVDRRDVPHTIRTCPQCGRTMYVHEPGEHGIGMKVRQGDTLAIPMERMRFSFNPLEGNLHATQLGLQRAAEGTLLYPLPDQTKQEAMFEEFALARRQCLDALRQSSLLAGLEVENEADWPKIWDAVKDKRDTPEFWRVSELSGIETAMQALEQGKSSSQVAWATIHAERARCMRIYKESLEQAIWMGQSARRLVDFLGLWDANKNNGDEEFWQIKFSEHPYVLPQVFSAPAVLIGEKAYIGGMKVDKKDARFVDYLFAGEASKDALLVELKTPATKLMGSKYRKVYKPSPDLSGAIVQVLDYRRQLTLDLESVRRASDTKQTLAYFNPRCLLLIGNGEVELSDSKKRESFEIFRGGVRDVEILTFDELFRKIGALATLFNLVYQPSPKQPPTPNR